MKGIGIYFLLSILTFTKTSLSANLQSFEIYKAKYEKTYSNSAEETDRLETFEENKNFIDEHNSQSDKTFTLGLNSFADMDRDEFVKTKTGLNSFPREPSPENVLSLGALSTFPESLDYRKQGLVVPRVRNQGNCGSCAFFGDMGAIEGAFAKKTGKLIELSKQQPGDCAYGYYYPEKKARGMCDGRARPELIFDYIRDVGAVAESNYPYLGKNQDCIMDKNNSRIVGRITGYKTLRYNYTVAELKAALYSNSPISMGINAYPREFSYYKSGIYRVKSCDGYLAAHAILLVGYGSENGDDYWIFKNSWGPNWGEKGYIRIATDYKTPEGVKCYDYEKGPYGPDIPIVE